MCPVCLNPFSKKRPPLLCGDCDHNVCEKDLNIIFTKGNGKCPLCRHLLLKQKNQACEKCTIIRCGCCNKKTKTEL